MTIQEEIERLDAEIKELDLPFDKGLPILQKRVWEIADRHNTDGPEILMLYFEWKNRQLNKEA